MSDEETRGGTLPAAAAYRLWAPAYGPETAVSALEDRMVRSVWQRARARWWLDAGCGTGRRSPGARDRAGRVVGVDLVPEMLAAGRRRGRAVIDLLAGDILRLPFRSGVFDTVWCRLALGHVADVDLAYRELARVAAPGADLLVSDFHSDAVAAGHRRTFRDGEGRLHEIEHHDHGGSGHQRAAEDAGWRLVRRLDGAAGPEERPFYERAGRLTQYESERGLPLVLVLTFRR